MPTMIPDDFDPPTRAVLAAIVAEGFTVTVQPVGGLLVLTATQPDGRRFVVRAADPYRGAVELAGSVGFDLADG